MEKKSSENTKDPIKELKKAISGEKNLQKDGKIEIISSEKTYSDDSKEHKHKKSPEKDEKINELTEDLQRLQAEFENYGKWAEKERAEFIKCSNASLINELLPLIDSFELALKNTEDQKNFVKGIDIIFTQLYSILKKFGLRQIDALGRKFDPHLHEVMLKEKSDKDEDIVIEELQKGYYLNDKVLRHSKVKISCK